MSFVAPPPMRRFTWRLTIPMLAALLLASCQSYEPAPLDMKAFDASLDARLLDTEPVTEFARRIDEARVVAVGLVPQVGPQPACRVRTCSGLG